MKDLSASGTLNIETSGYNGLFGDPAYGVPKIFWVKAVIKPKASEESKADQAEAKPADGEPAATEKKVEEEAKKPESPKKEESDPK